jgi:hypothetical protein
MEALKPPLPPTVLVLMAVQYASGSATFVDANTTHCELAGPFVPAKVRVAPFMLKLWMDGGGACTTKVLMAEAMPGIGRLSVKSLLLALTTT